MQERIGISQTVKSLKKTVAVKLEKDFFGRTVTVSDGMIASGVLVPGCRTQLARFLTSHRCRVGEEAQRSAARNQGKGKGSAGGVVQVQRGLLERCSPTAAAARSAVDRHGNVPATQANQSRVWLICPAGCGAPVHFPHRFALPTHGPPRRGMLRLERLSASQCLSWAAWPVVARAPLNLPPGQGGVRRIRRRGCIASRRAVLQRGCVGTPSAGQ